jgi:hypothetical protein
MRLAILAICTVLFSSPSQACDVVALATNFIYGWQQADGNGDASCSDTGNYISCGAGSRIHRIIGM